MKKTIWGNTIVKNEDKYLYFAVESVIEFLDKLLIWDTGSSDNTIEIIKLLKKNNVAFVFAHEGGEKAPYTEEPTADFIYARLHGGGKKYVKGYPDKEIVRWATKVKAWNKAGLDTFVYFSNEAKIYSPTGAEKLMRLLVK